MSTMERRATLLVAGLCVVAACSDAPPGRTFFERNIQPILEQKCAGNTSGCHATNVGDVFQFAAGNLDVTSFENIQKRRDTLAPFGAYPHSLFLIKAVGAAQLKMQYGDRFLDIDVQHSGGSILDVGSDAYFALQSWLENGATENGLKPASPPVDGDGDCSTSLPPGFTAAPYLANAAFGEFESKVQPILTNHGCAAGSCHGAPQSDFYITCGDTDEQLAFNFSQSWSFVNTPVDDSQLLRVPLAVASGGRGHTGGDQFAQDDTDYQDLRAWAETVGKLDFAGADPGKQFFEANVQPVLLTRGCAFQACHSPQAGNDFKLRSGAIGFFSAVALQKNYDLLSHEFMAFEFADARRGRAVAKGILEDDPRVGGGQMGGIAHRGGPVLEAQGDAMMFSAQPAACPATYDPLTATPFCTIQEWVRIERAALGAEVTPMAPADLAQVVYVQRTTGPTTDRLQFDTFQGGADLMIVDTQFGANQALAPADGATATSLLGSCAGQGLVAGANADVQAPDVSHDGTRIAFAARTGPSDPLGVWVVDINGGSCTRITPAVADSNGLKVHNFDPAWSPDGTAIVFASTRGKAGATRSRKRALPQSDLWRIEITGFTANPASLEQMTFLSNSEISPQFMREGRVTMTTEKASDGFYQLSGRRMNWDLTDYHPLLGQRKESVFADPADPTAMRPSIGYASITDIREGADGSFLIILSDLDAAGAPMAPGGAGALGVFNRSVGPFESGRTDPGYLPSVKVLDATQRYRTPVSLPDGSIMVSRATSGTNFDIVMVNPRTGQAANLFTASNQIRVDAQLVYKYPARKMYDNRRQLVFGGSAEPGATGDAVVHVPDAPMLFTLLTSNLRRGRPVEALRGARYLAFYSEGLCPTGPCTPNTNGIFQARESLGRVELASDGSTRVRVPSQTGVVLELQDGSGNPLVTMSEEHQFGPGERISMGIREPLFDAVCGGCHGSISGSELDVVVTPDALTGASASLSATRDPVTPN